MLIVDSREKWTQTAAPNNIRSYFKKHDIQYIVRKLDCGDYMLSGGSVSVDRKQNLAELAKNLLNPKDKARFFAEVRRSKQQKIKLVILCEHGGKVKTLQDVMTWKNKYGKVQGKALANAIYKLSIAYGVDVVFCDKRSTGKKIIDILEGEKE